METEIINKVASSGIITIDLEEYYQNSGDKTKTMEIKSDIDRVRKKAGISNQMKKKKE